MGFAAVSVVAIAAVNINYALQNSNDLSVLALANVEALADENSANGPTPCGGDKVQGECQCLNTINCKDLYGCQ